MKITKGLLGVTTLLLSLVLSLGACSSLTHSRDEAALKKVKRVALVGFAVYQPVPASLSLGIGGGGLSADREGSLIARKANHVDQMYAGLSKALRTNARWKVIPTGTMTKNKQYKSSYTRTMKGWQNKIPPGKDKEKFLVNGVMDEQSLRILGTKGRKQLLKGLGVDAIVTATIRVSLKGMSVMGIGSRYPQAMVSFQVYDAYHDGPIWFEGGITGDKGKTSVGSTGFFDKKILNTGALQSAKNAFRQIGKKEG